MALALPAHAQRGVHVHVVAREVQADEELEDGGVGGLGAGEEDEQAGGGAAVGDHVEHGAEAGRLAELARRPAVEGVEQAGDGVEEAAAAGVEGHEVEGGEGEDDAGVAWSFAVLTDDWLGEVVRRHTDQVRGEEEDILVRLLVLVFRDLVGWSPGMAIQWSTVAVLYVCIHLFSCFTCHPPISSLVRHLYFNTQCDPDFRGCRNLSTDPGDVCFARNSDTKTVNGRGKLAC